MTRRLRSWRDSEHPWMPPLARPANQRRTRVATMPTAQITMRAVPPPAGAQTKKTMMARAAWWLSMTPATAAMKNVDSMTVTAMQVMTAPSTPQLKAPVARDGLRMAASARREMMTVRSHRALMLMTVKPATRVLTPIPMAMTTCPHAPSTSVPLWRPAQRGAKSGTRAVVVAWHAVTDTGVAAGFPQKMRCGSGATTMVRARSTTISSRMRALKTCVTALCMIDNAAPILTIPHVVAMVC